MARSTFWHNALLSTAASLFGLSMVACAAPGMSANRSDAQARVVAEASLSGYLDQIPAGQETRFGFGERQEMARATVGTPMPVLALGPKVSDSLARATDSSWKLAVEQDRWRVPVVVDGKPRVFITVEAVGDFLQAVDFGGASLAQEITAIDSMHPGKRKALLRMDALRCDVLIVDRTGNGFEKGEYHALGSAKAVFGTEVTPSKTRVEWIGAIRGRIRQNLTVRP
jgi:hypothetical protein